MDFRSSATVGLLCLAVGFGVGTSQFVLPAGAVWLGIASALVGLTAWTRQDGPNDPIATLTSKVRRAEAGDDVDFATEQDDDIGQLYAAVGDLVERYDERERECQRQLAFTNDLFDAIDDVFFVLDRRGNLRRWNRSKNEVLGYSDDEIASKNAVEFFAGEDQAQIARKIVETFETGQCRVEADYVTKDGEPIPYEFVAARIEDPNGTEVIAGVGRDITERKRYERELERTTGLLKQTERLGKLGGWELDLSSGPPHEMTVTDEFYRLHDVSPDEPWTLEKALEYLPPDDRETVRSAVEHAIETSGGYDVVVRSVSETGEEKWIRGRGESVVEDGEVVKMVGALQDVTERREQRLELERTKELLEQSQRIADVGGWTTDMRGETETHETEWTEKLFDIFELSPDEQPLAEEVIDFYHPDDRDERRADVQRAIEAGVGWDAEARLVTGEGNLRWVRTAGEPVLEDDEVTHLFGAVQDITERKERERQIEALVENTTNPTFIKDRDGTYEFVNQAAAEVFGLDAEEMVGKRDDDLFDPDSAATLIADDERVQKSGERLRDERVLTVDGEEHVFLDDKYPYRDSDGSILGVMGISRDITDRKERERELERTMNLLEQAERMAGLVGFEVDVTGEPPYVPEFSPGFFDFAAVPEGTRLTLDDLFEAAHPEDLERVRADVERAIEAGEGWDHEVRSNPAAGDVRWFHSLGEPVVEDGDVVSVRATFQDVTDRKKRERELERTRDMLQQSQRIASVGAWELEVRSDAPSALTMTDESYRIFELPVDEDIDLERAFEFYHPDDRQRLCDCVERTIEHGEEYEAELRLTTTNGNERWVRTIGEPVIEDGGVVKVRGPIQDITEQKEREIALETLHETARGLLDTASPQAAATLVIDAAESILDVSAVGIYLYDETENHLRPAAVSSTFAEHLRDGVIPVGPDEEGLLWHSFVTDNTSVIGDADAETLESPFDDEVDHGIVIPVGAHGVFVAVDDRESVDADIRQLIETLVATTETAFDRLEGESRLRERDAELEARNERLRRQMRINETIRSVDRSLVGATSQESLEAEVCEGLVDGDDVAFAWIGGFEAGGTTLAPRAWSGESRGYLDGVSLDREAPNPEPAVEAAVSGSPVAVPNVARKVKQEPWRRTALAARFQSVLAVPLAFDEYRFGVLAVYATESDAFDDLERKVFAELGESIANAITSVATKRALYADMLVSLRLRIEGDADLLTGIARAADCEVHFEGLATHGADESRLFVRTVGADASVVSDALADRFAVRNYRLVSESDGGAVFEVTTGGASIVSKLVRHGGRPVSITADAAGMDVVVDLPVSTDVRAFVEMLEEDFTVDLVSRRHVSRSNVAKQELVEMVLGRLTARQREVLRTAYLAGFFNWPRDTTGEELAELLGVSQPTVNRHLRLAEQRIVRQLFDPEARRA